MSSLRLVITGPQRGKRTVRETLRGYAEEDVELCGQRIETLVLPLPTENDPRGCEALSGALGQEDAVLLFVADMTGDYVEALARLATLPAVPAHVPVEVLLHKADRLPQAEGFAALATIGRRFRRMSARRPLTLSSATTTNPPLGSSLENGLSGLSLLERGRENEPNAESTHPGAVTIPHSPRRLLESSGGESWDASVRSASTLSRADTLGAVQWSPDSLAGQEMHFQLASTHDRTLLVSVGHILQRHAAASPALEALADRLRAARPGSRRILLMDRRSAACVAMDTLGSCGRASGLGALAGLSGGTFTGCERPFSGQDPLPSDAALCIAAAEVVDAACDLSSMYSHNGTALFSMRNALPPINPDGKSLFVDADDLGHDIVAVCVHDGSDDTDYAAALSVARSMTLPQIASVRHSRALSAACGGMRA